jgi:hypothetical protein
MHYIANAIFHLQKGKLAYFHSSCVFGALPDDEDSFAALLEEGSEIPKDLSRVSEWLEDRLEELIQKLHNETSAAGFPAPKSDA